MKFEIKSWMNGSVLFSIETTSWKLAVEAAVKSRANLSYANLSSANLSYANLRSANLSYADLRSANLSYANLRSANLSYADLRSADLSSANLSSADLSSADLSYANLSYANLSYAKNSSLAIAMTRILPQGDIIGWKKCRDNVLAKLLIPAKAKRSHAFGRKCRASYAKVLDVIGAKIGLSLNQSFKPIEYRKGKTVKPDKWCDDFTEECAGGIHFFITREEAESFTL